MHPLLPQDCPLQKLHRQNLSQLYLNQVSRLLRKRQEQTRQHNQSHTNRVGKEAWVLEIDAPKKDASKEVPQERYLSPPLRQPMRPFNSSDTVLSQLSRAISGFGPRVSTSFRWYSRDAETGNVTSEQQKRITNSHQVSSTGRIPVSGMP
jgi:hypothetical protein